MDEEITRFSQAIIEKLGYYVYLLSNPETGRRFYVGKGHGNRIFDHARGVISEDTGNEKLEEIREIKSKGLRVDYRVIRHGLTEKESLEVEAALIDFLGIENLTNLVVGHGSDDRGLMTVAEIINKYDAPAVDITEPSILITINRLYRQGMSASELYEAVRGNWVIGDKRRSVKYAFAVYKGIIREVYEIERWYQVKARSDQQKRKNRWAFEGKVAENMRHYVGGSTANYSSSQNPIRYIL